MTLSYLVIYLSFLYKCMYSGPWLTTVMLLTLCWGKLSDSVRRWSERREPRCSWWTWGPASCTPDCSTSPQRRRRRRRSHTGPHLRSSGFLSVKELPAMLLGLVKLATWRRQTPPNISIQQLTNRCNSTIYCIMYIVCNNLDVFLWQGRPVYLNIFL